MKRALCIVFLFTLAGLGCMPLREENKPPSTVMKQPAPPVVTEDGITEKNAAEKAEALRRELEHALEKKAPAAAAD